jgi:uncharacterized protein (TIGR02001 family)
VTAFDEEHSAVNSKGMMAALVAALAGLLGIGSAQAQVQVSGSAALTSDYVWRGSSQSDGDPAVQAGAKISIPSGWYASVWGSNVSFKPDNGARSEFDLVAGWSGALAPDWTLDANLTRYVYPGTGRALDWTELNTTVTWKQRAWLQVAHSNDALAGGHRGTYAQLGVRAAARTPPPGSSGGPVLAGHRAGPGLPAWPAQCHCLADPGMGTARHRA